MNKKNLAFPFWTLALLCVLTASSAPWGTAFAQENAAALKLATVDVNRVMNELGEAKQKKKELEDLSSGAKAKLEGQRKNLEVLEKKIKDQKLGENSDEAVKFRKAAREFQDAASDAENKIKGEFMKVNKAISDKVLAAVERYSKANGIDVVLDKSPRLGSPVLFGDAAVDITDAVIKELNR